MADGAGASVWRTALGRTLLGWMLLMLTVALACGLIVDYVSYEAIQWGVACLFLGAPAGLLVWLALALFRSRRRTWPALAGMVAFCAILVAVAGPLFKAGVYLNFLAHRGAYDALVADARAGRLGFKWGQRGCFHGIRRGITYQSLECNGREIFFNWADDAPGSLLGVVYSEGDCPRARPEPEAEWTGAADPPTIKNAGYLDQRIHLQGRYCLSFAVF